jgi:hypothetical protein
MLKMLVYEDFTDATDGTKHQLDINFDTHGMTVSVGDNDIILDLSDGLLSVYISDSEQSPNLLTSIQLPKLDQKCN